MRGLFFCSALFGGDRQRRRPRAEGGEAGGDGGEAACDLGKAGQAFDAGLVHVEGAVDLDLQRLDALARPAVGLGDVAAGEGSVAGDDEARGGEDLGGGVNEPAVAGAADRIRARFGRDSIALGRALR